MDRAEITDRVLATTQELFRVMHAASCAEWLQLDLTMAQVKALFALAGEESTTVGQLAQKLGVHLPAASHAADRLVQIGLAERYEDPEDRRRTFVQLTPGGQALADRLQQVRRDQLRAWLSRLEVDELTALLCGLQAIVAVAADGAPERPSCSTSARRTARAES